MYDAIIVGAGLFGSIIARELRSQEREVIVVDANKQNAGSTPAACLMKPGWFSGMDKVMINNALDLLDKHYGVETLKFRTAKLLDIDVHWVNPRKVLSEEKVFGSVVEINDGSVLLSDNSVLEAKNIIVAAGVWCKHLLGINDLVGKAGCAFTWKGHLKQPFISPWAPYKQIVGFNRGLNEIWVGDGSAILTKNWSEIRRAQSLERCASSIKMSKDEATSHFGIRPYIPNVKPCYFKQLTESVWVATGGAKNGTIAAAWCAHELGQMLK